MFPFAVPFDVPFGVGDALSTLAFREPDRGVMLELKKALTGVATSSDKCPLLSSTRLPLRPVEKPLVARGAAILAVSLPFAADLGDCVLAFAIGRRLTMALGFSEFITAVPYLVGVAEWLCGE